MVHYFNRAYLPADREIKSVIDKTSIRILPVATILLLKSCDKQMFS